MTPLSSVLLPLQCLFLLTAARLQCPRQKPFRNSLTISNQPRANDYDELLFVLNRAFGNIYKREMDFISELPRMWVRDDEYMGKHIGMFEDGKLCSVVGIYPLPVRIAGEELSFATTGKLLLRTGSGILLRYLLRGG